MTNKNPFTIQQKLFASEALIGLASVENFSSISLKSASLPLTVLWLPYKTNMLLHIKGRNHVQTRLVEPSYKSINRGDCFILLVTNQIYGYIGQYANVIEMAHCRKLCAHLMENKDMGSCEECIFLNDPQSGNNCIESKNWSKFWKLLNKPTAYEIPTSGDADEDESIEKKLIKSNRFYEYKKDSLYPMSKYWGRMPKYQMLDEKKILIFDFGSELYLWIGKHAKPSLKNVAIKVVKEYYDTAVISYSNCVLNPQDYARKLGNRSKSSDNITQIECKTRAEWCIFGKINQNLETILFKTKFSDWPEFEVEALEKDYVAALPRRSPIIESLNGKELFEGAAYEEPNFILEKSSLGRGDHYYDRDTMRHFQIITKSLSKWQLNEFHYDSVNNNEFMHFYTNESYIVRWIYSISVIVRELNGNLSKRSTVGRDRCVYFCWNGMDVTSNEKGAIALLTIELDNEKGAQVRVSQGEENTVFVRLFKIMLIHKGGRKECFERRNTWRVYQVLGNLETELMLHEVDCKSMSLRSRGSMLLINGATAVLRVWHGCKSPKHTRLLAEHVANELKENYGSEHLFLQSPVEIHIDEEGEEDDIEYTNIFDDDFTARNYGSLMNVESKIFDYTPRIFHFSSVEGKLRADEILFPLRTADFISPFPFNQSCLYDTRQPATFMIDDGNTLWIWMGWWPNDNNPISTSPDRSHNNSPVIENRAGVYRWIFERRATLETAVLYWRAKYGDNEEHYYDVNGFVVWAGLEPTEFKALFPYWSDRADVREISLMDGRPEGVTSITDVLSKITKSEYPLSVLTQRPLPEGVDPTHLELYLNDGDFRNAFDMNKDDFNALPLWKQTKMKKASALF